MNLVTPIYQHMVAPATHVGIDAIWTDPWISGLHLNISQLISLDDVQIKQDFGYTSFVDYVGRVIDVDGTFRA
jgi:hypothetical protein